MLYGVLCQPASMCTMCTQYPLGPEEGTVSLDLKLQIIVSHTLDSGN